MKLFDLKNHSLNISEEAYALKPFKVIWDRDKTKGKDKAFAELSYIFYMEDFRSDFFDIIDDSERSQEIIKNLVLPEDWKEDAKVKSAREFYRERTSDILSLNFLKDAKYAVEQIRTFFRSVDLLETNKKSGTLKFDVKKLTGTIKDSAELLDNLMKLENQVKRDLQSQAEVRGGKEKSIFEDGIQ